MIKHLLLLLSMLACSLIQAQTLSGKVTDTDGQPVAFANIYFLNSTLSAVADVNGQYQLDVASGTFTLQCSAVGFASKIIELNLDGNAQKLDISLSQSAETLSEVIVTANKREEIISKVATSVTSLSAKKLEDTRTWGLGGLTALVPNYTYQELGVPFQQVQSIRGIQVFS
ncbi:MAG: carboxypeptidase-like regulatory domain-containing protein, partial [Saprospiraceae bacterium]